MIVILGGRNKGLDFSPLMAELHHDRIKGIVLIGECRSALRALLNGTPNVREAVTLEDAVTTASSMAHPGATVLFSPACASFDMFKNFEDRGRVFKEIVRGLG